MDEGLRQYLLEEVVPLGEKVGQGAYGYVEKVSVGGTVCAAKKIHQVLASTDVLRERFYSECRIMSQLRHPHIVQFLGVYLPSAEEIKKEESFEESSGFTPSSSLGLSFPWLIMEYLPINLDNFLKKKPLIPFSVKTSLLLDIAKGLYYLHSRKLPIIHGYLTAKNVFITLALEAKIAGFGNAMVVNLLSTRSAIYMPPEVFSSDGTRNGYSTSTDIFSFGVNILYMIVQEVPHNIKMPVVVDSSAKLIAVSEVQRRYFDKARMILADSSKPEHRLIKLAEECLRNDRIQRPCIQDLYHDLSHIKDRIPVYPLDRMMLTDIIRQNVVKVRTAAMSRISYNGDCSVILSLICSLSSTTNAIYRVMLS